MGSVEPVIRDMVDGRIADHMQAILDTHAYVGREEVTLAHAIRLAVTLFTLNAERDGQVFLFGNGGSGTIAEHIACDMLLLHQWRAFALSGHALSTSVANDFSHHEMFARQVQWMAREGDVLVAMSVSGQSANTLFGLRAGHEINAACLCLTGSHEDNDMNRWPHSALRFWTPVQDAGLVQAAHFVILHTIVDVANQ
jgi:D-sedoheptulose 7-phosphate isomerase